MYVVICETPDGERHNRVSVECADLKSAIEKLDEWFIPGPNGPAREAKLYRDGVQISPWEEIEMLGYTPLVRRNPNTGRERLYSCVKVSERIRSIMNSLADAFGGHSQYTLSDVSNAIFGHMNNNGLGGHPDDLAAEAAEFMGTETYAEKIALGIRQRFYRDSGLLRPQGE